MKKSQARVKEREREEDRSLNSFRVPFRMRLPRSHAWPPTPLILSLHFSHSLSTAMRIGFQFTFWLLLAFCRVVTICERTKAFKLLSIVLSLAIQRQNSLKALYNTLLHIKYCRCEFQIETKLNQIKNAREQDERVRKNEEK